jgi:hypothetical protein
MIQINLFTSSTNSLRLPLTKAALRELSQITDANKQKIELLIYHSIQDEDKWAEIAQPVAESGIEVTLVGMHDDTYIDKVRIAQQTNHKYSCKWDDDVFVNHDVWNFMIDNVEVVDSPDVSILTPCLSNGMPSVDMFIEDFLTEEEAKTAYDICIRDNVQLGIFGCNYQSLYDYVKNTKKWDGRAYWNKVVSIDPTLNKAGLPWYYSIVKGVHPARFSYDFNMLIAKHAESNLDKLKNSSNLYLQKGYPTPYLCNNLFIASTQFYIDSQELFFDHWDEGQINMLSQNRGQNPAFVRNCYGIHMAYGCTNRQKEIEKYYIDNIFSKL